MPKTKTTPSNLIGCNIKPWITPGGFSSVLGKSRDERCNKRKVSLERIKEAARESLAKRGVPEGPSEFDRTVVPKAG